MKNERPVLIKKISAGIITWSTGSVRTYITISAMTVGNCTIFEQKAEYRTAIPRPSRYMDVKTVAAVSIDPSACINIISKKC